MLCHKQVSRAGCGMPSEGIKGRKCYAISRYQGQVASATYIKVRKCYFLHDRPWISPQMISISNELLITIHMSASQLSGHCDVISSWLWRHQQNENRASETRGRCVKIVVLSSFMDSFCLVSNTIMYLLSWRTISGLTRVLFWYLFPSLLRNSGNRHQNNSLDA